MRIGVNHIQEIYKICKFEDCIPLSTWVSISLISINLYYLSKIVSLKKIDYEISIQ